MDTTGAVIIDDQIDTVALAPLVGGSHRVEGARIPAMGWGPPYDSERWVVMASILQALMVHVRRGRAGAFGVDSRDPSTFTVAQLAALVRSHPGSAGQAFEFAVADSLNIGHGPLLEATREALDSIRVPMSRPKAIVMGLEKINDPHTFLSVTSEQLQGKRLRVSARGRPADAQRALSKLVAQGTRIEAHAGELAHADLLIYDDEGSHVVTGSVKISHASWQVPPAPPRLWFVGGDRFALTGRRLAGLREAGCAVVHLPERWLDLFATSFNLVTNHLAAIDLQRVRSDRVLSRIFRGDRTIESVIDELLDRAETLAGVYDLEPPPELRKVRAKIDITAILPGGAQETVTGSGLSVIQRAGLVIPARQFFTQPYVA